MGTAWDALTDKLRELEDFSVALRLLHWDQHVNMPPGGAPARARAIGTVEGATHRLLTAPEIGDLLEQLSGDAGLDESQRASVRVLGRDYALATKVPEDLVREIGEVRGLAYQAWTEAREASDFSVLRPHLERLLELKKQEADALGWEGERYDAMLDVYEPGTTTADIDGMFDELVKGLKPLVEANVPAGDPPGFLLRSYDTARQEAFCHWLVGRLGFDTAHGRLDRSPHPFTMMVARGDVRQTTRTESTGVLQAVYATMHETGHALYEQGLPDELLGLPAGRVPSLGMHESQSRLWENQVGRSRPFTDFLLPHLKDRFPDELGMVTPEEFHRGVNFVTPSLIRVNADELTYNLHIALRFRLEVALFRDELAVDDLPAAWDDAMEEFLGIRPDSEATGVLQDMHWSLGGFGYFPTYTIGNLYAAALYARAEAEIDGLADELRAGTTDRLLEWLRANVHRHAYLFEAKDLIAKVVGGPVGAEPLLDYLEAKYTEL